MTPLVHFSAGSIRLVPQSTFKNTKKETQLNKCNFTRRPLLLRQPAFSLNWISTRNVSKTRILTSAVEADVAVEAEPNPKQETSEEPEPVSKQTEEATSTSTSADVKVKQVRPGRNSDLPRVKNEDLVPGATFTGTVRSIQPFGLFVDFGAFTEGLVHISQISSSYVKDVKALFTIGQEVEVRLMEANMETSRISLTMRAPGDEKRKGPPSRGGTGTGTGTGAGAGKGGRRRQERRRPRIGEGDIIIGTVKEITGEGALVTLRGGEDGILPVSEQVAAVYGSEAGSTLEAGQEIEVRVLSMVEGKVTLTMKEEQFMEKELLAKKREEEEFFKVDIDREFEVLEQIGVEYEEVEEGEEGGGEDTGEVVEEAATGDPTVDVDDGTIVVNPFVFTFLRSRYAANAEKRLELIGAVKKAGSVVAVKAASVSGVAGDGSTAVVEESSEQAGGEEVGAVSETLSSSVPEEPAVASGVEGGEVAAVETVPEVGESGSLTDSNLVEGSASVAEEAVAVSELVGSEVLEAGAVPEAASDAGSVSVAEEPVALPEVPVVEELVAATSKVEGGEVAAARAVPEVSESEASSEIGSVSVAEEPIAVSEVEKGEVTAAGSGSEVAESEVASDSTVTEASIGEMAVVGAASDSTASETKTEEVADEEVASIRVGDEKPEVSEATPEATPNQAPEVKATISPSLVKQLREETGAGMMDCKKVLAETNGDVAKAQEYLRKKGLASADKRASRATAEGRIGAYVHDGRIGVLIEVNCETDFVSRGDIFRELVEDLAMQVAACPQVTYVTSEEVPEETVKKEKEIEMQREDILSKPENIREKIVEGRIRKRLEEFALLEQPYIKSDDKVVVKDHVKQTIAKIGENIKVNRFVRFNLGEGLEKKTQDFAAEVAAQTAAKPDVATAVDEKPETTETAEKAPTSTVKISPALVKELREETGAGMMDCKKALAETGGDIEKAQEYLRKKGLSSADKKSSRVATEGLISAYIHDSRIGCLIEVNSETDFVARNEKFKELVDDLAMQVVACPQVEYVSIDEVPASAVEKEKAIEMQREDLQSKPEQIREKIVQGRISKRLGELALLEQPFIKDDSVTVKELVKRTIASLGENIKVRRFVRFTLGENKD